MNGAYLMSDENNLLQLVYVSAATEKFSSDDLDELLAKARRHNESVNVTGILLYAQGTFFQVLEGAPEDVDALYDKIAKDSRHCLVLRLARENIATRNFGEWSMGFVRNEERVKELPGFVDFFNGRTFVDLDGDTGRIRTILDGFRRGRWRRTFSECANEESANVGA